MAKYILVPTSEVDVEQFLEDQPVPKGLCRGTMCPKGSLAYPHVHSRTGRIVVEYGDWIAADADGEHFYPITDETFQKMFRPVKVENAQ